MQKGKEYVGPCPVCKDGEDRFHVKEGANGPVFGCRYCMDGGNDPSSENAKKVWELLRGGHSLQNDGGTPVNAPQRSPRARKEQAPPKPQPLPTGANVTRYDYTTAEGEIVFVVIRRDYADKPKRFSQWVPLYRRRSRKGSGCRSHQPNGSPCINCLLSEHNGCCRNC